MPIEFKSYDLTAIVSPNHDIETLCTGFGGTRDGILEPAEGPLWWHEGGYLLFTDIAASSIMKWKSDEGVTLFKSKSNKANGLTRDSLGRLIVCEHETRAVSCLDQSGTRKILANNYYGISLNSPNDVIADSRGNIYFTDPLYGILPYKGELGFSGVYRIGSDGILYLLVDDFSSPNGLCLSPSEDVLYISDSDRNHIRAFVLLPDGNPDLTSDHVLSEMTRELPGNLDGMKVDLAGNLYCSGPGGVWILDREGTHLGTLLTGANQTTNVGWGGVDWKTLYISTEDSLCSIRLNLPGVPVPAIMHRNV